MTFNDLEAACDGYFCRSLSAPFVSALLPRGNWNHVSFPMSECTDADNPTVHFLEVITGHNMNISFEDLGGHYKHAVSNKDLQLLPSPFGPKVPVSSDVKLH